MTGFIKNPQLLEEDYRVDDLLDFSSEIERLRSAVRRISSSALIGYVGVFGSGKSTTLYQLQKQLAEDKDYRWFEFDAWKYPERRDLWEGFVLDIADQLGQKKQTQKKIEGRGGSGKAIGAVAKISKNLGMLPIASAIVEKVSELFERHPIGRVFEIQELLRGMLSSLKEKDIVIAIEDLDRSGDAGRFFMETLRQFVKNNLPEKRIIALIPIGTEVYDRDDHRMTYQKALDYIWFFKPQSTGFKKFIAAVFDPSLFEECKTGQQIERTTPWSEQLLDWFNVATTNKLTVREIKATLRSANMNYLDLKDKDFPADPRVVMAFTLLEHITTEGGSRWIARLNTKNDMTGSCPIFTFLQAIGRNTTMRSFYENQQAFPIVLVEERKFGIPSFPPEFPGRQKKGYLSRFYLLPFGYTE